MNKAEWYRDSILWKAERKNSMLGEHCQKWSDTPADRTDCIVNVLGEDAEAVLVFWHSSSRWTVLGAHSIYSFYDNKIIECDLDSINKNISLGNIEGLSSQREKKTKAEYLYIKNTDQLIWAPAGNTLFSLWNILQMFPLKNRLQQLSDL